MTRNPGGLRSHSLHRAIRVEVPAGPCPLADLKPSVRLPGLRCHQQRWASSAVVPASPRVSVLGPLPVRTPVSPDEGRSRLQRDPILTNSACQAPVSEQGPREVRGQALPGPFYALHPVTPVTPREQNTQRREQQRKSLRRVTFPRDGIIRYLVAITCVTSQRSRKPGRPAFIP